MSESIRAALKAGKRLLGAWAQIPNPGIAGILAGRGFNWICADMEYAEFDISALARLTEAAHSKGAFAVARVSENAKKPIRKPPDTRVDCVIEPIVNNAEEAKTTVSYAKYPPDRAKGFSFCNANSYGGHFKEEAENANIRTAVVDMIESTQAVENIDDILSTEGMDDVFVGPCDMRSSYGLTGQASHTVIQTAIKKVVEACTRHGKPAGPHIADAGKKQIGDAPGDRSTFLAPGTDTVFIRKNADETLKAGRTEE